MKYAKKLKLHLFYLFFLALFTLFIQTHILIADTQLKSKSLYHSKSQFDNQDGKKATLSNWSGTPVVIAMLYTSCPASCPLTMSDLKAIEKGLSSEEKKKVQFAIFSFDSENDTPKHLKAFSEKQSVDLTHWSFLHGSPRNIRELAALLGIKFKKMESGDYDHSNIITILDSEGVVVHQQIGVRKSPEESIEILKKLLRTS